MMIGRKVVSRTKIGYAVVCIIYLHRSRAVIVAIFESTPKPLSAVQLTSTVLITCRFSSEVRLVLVVAKEVLSCPLTCQLMTIINY